MPLNLTQRGELETIAKLLRNGEKPGVSSAVNRRLVKVLRAVLGDLASGSDNVAFDESPIRSLIEAILAADIAWTAPVCPPASIPGPVLMSSTITLLDWVGFSVDFIITQRYAGSPSDPLGAAFVQVQLGHRPIGGVISWITDAQANWALTIGAAPATQNDAVAAILVTDKMVLRFRFLDIGSNPISDWSVSDELTTT
jgi:hypothetical protein